MPVYKVLTARQKYKTIAKKTKNLHQLTGRQSREDTAARINFVIANLHTLDMKSNSLFVDVGCGDGSFLKKIGTKFNESVGILPSPEECFRVNSTLNPNDGIRIELGTTEDLTTSNLGSNPDLILCNSVLHGVGFELKSVKNSFQNFASYQKPGQILYIGEMPINNEMENRSYGLSFKEYMLWCIKTNSYRRLISNIFLYIRACFSDYIYIIQETNMFFCPPHEFEALGNEYGYHLTAVYNSSTNEPLNSYNMPTVGRFDYIFIRT